MILSLKTLTLLQAHIVLEQCSALVSETDELFNPDLAPLTGEDENEFAYFGWTEEGKHMFATFAEGENREVKIIGSSMWFIDTDGEEFMVTVLEPMGISDFVNSLGKNL